MKGLATARALIIDDDHTEISTAVCALGRMGIGVVFHHATSDVEVTSIEGIHLVFLDMVLGDLCSDQSDDKIIVGSALERLKALVPPDRTSPLIVCCWTKHTDLVNAFEKAFFKAYNVRAEMSSVESCRKPTQGEEAKAIDFISEMLVRAFEKLKPFHIVYEWQQLVHSAATQTTSALFNTVDACRSPFNSDAEAAFRVLAILAVAEGGKALVNIRDHIGSALGRTLSALLADRLEYEAGISLSTLSEDLAQRLAQEVEVVIGTTQHGRQPQVEASVTPDHLLVELNRMLLFGERGSDVSCPGHLLDVTKLPQDIKGTTGRLKSDLLQDAFVLPNGAGSRNNDRFVALSIVPPCDYAQGKSKTSLFLLGVLTESLDGLRERTGYLKQIGPVSRIMSGQAAPSPCWLILNLHYAISLASHQIEKVSSEAVLTRLREIPLLDVVHAYSTYSSRPGVLRVSMQDFHGGAMSSDLPQAAKAPEPSNPPVSPPAASASVLLTNAEGPISSAP